MKEIIFTKPLRMPDDMPGRTTNSIKVSYNEELLVESVKKLTNGLWEENIFPGIVPLNINELPEIGEKNILYLIPSDQDDLKNAYLWIDNKYEQIGDGAGSQITVDPTPTEGSTNPVASGGVYTGLAGKANASVYAKDGDGNAHVTTPLSIGDGVATSDGAVASGRSDDGASIQARGDGAVASGYADGEGANIQATGDGAVASGYADGTVGNVSAEGNGSQAFGIGTQTKTEGQMVLGKCNVVDTDGDYALIVGNGTANDARSNAFAIDWNGNLVLFNAGTPVVLTPAKLAQLIA